MAMKMITDSNFFITKDTPLAAWLRTQGFEIVRIDDVSHPCLFFFEDSPALRESVRCWDLMKGEADTVQRYHHNYRDLLHKIHAKVRML